MYILHIPQIFRECRQTCGGMCYFNPKNPIKHFIDVLLLSKIFVTKKFVTLCEILYHLHNLKNLKNTHEIVLLVKLQVLAATLLKVSFLHGCFLRFLNCTRYQIEQSVSNLEEWLQKILEWSYNKRMKANGDRLRFLRCC